MSSFEEVMAKLAAGEEGAQAELDALVAERVSAGVEEEVRTLKGKNDLLIGEKKRLGAKLSAFADADGTPITPERLAELLEIAAEKDTTGKAAAGDEEAREALRKKLQTPLMAKIAAIEAERDEALGFLNERLISSEMLELMVKFGVDPSVAPAARALLRERGGYSVSRLEEEGKPPAFRAQYKGADEIPVPLEEHIKEWVGSDEAKWYRLAKDTHGGGADPGAPARSKTQGNPWSKESWNLTEQGRIMKADRARANKLAAEAGRAVPN